MKAQLLGLLGLLLAIAGCVSEPVVALPSDAQASAQEADAGLADGRAEDAAPPLDAATEDAGVAEPDGGAQLPDGGVACEELRWVGEPPTMLPISGAVPHRLLASAQGFELFYQHETFELCDGPCPVLRRVPTRGEDAYRAVAYWAMSPDPVRLFAGISEDGSAGFAAESGGELRWTLGLPTPASGWQSGGRAPLSSLVEPGAGMALADVAILPSARRFFIASQRAVARGFEDFALREVQVDELLQPLDLRPMGAFLGFPYRAPSLNVNAAGALIVAGLQDWDFPPTVTLGALEGPGFGILGTSCGVDAYQVLPIFGDVAAVLQGCGARLELDLRTTVAPRRSSVVAADRFAEASSPVALVEDGSAGLVIAYWRGAGDLMVVHVSRDGEILSQGLVPGATFAWAEIIPRTLALARHSDGTFAIAWAVSLGGGALNRFTLGCR